MQKISGRLPDQNKSRQKIRALAAFHGMKKMEKNNAEYANKIFTICKTIFKIFDKTCNNMQCNFILIWNSS